MKPLQLTFQKLIASTSNWILWGFLLCCWEIYVIKHEITATNLLHAPFLSGWLVQITFHATMQAVSSLLGPWWQAKMMDYEIHHFFCHFNYFWCSYFLVSSIVWVFKDLRAVDIKLNICICVAEDEKTFVKQNNSNNKGNSSDLINIWFWIFPK